MVRLKAFWLAVCLCRLIRFYPSEWKLSSINMDRKKTVLTNEVYRLQITIEPCYKCESLRIFDNLRVAYMSEMQVAATSTRAYQDVWIGVFGRILIRRAVRRYVLARVFEQLFKHVDHDDIAGPNESPVV